ncbi:MAG: dihydropteroate synthase [Bacteroidetes bacterium]|nr:dihydropteroate synthase [Bacteroidota bacterium]
MNKNFINKKTSINVSGNLLDLSLPRVMGILNITNDSFYDGGKYNTDEKISQRAEQILSEGAAIIDVGAYSSRPGAINISEEEELSKLKNALSIIRKKFPEAIISVDTFRSSIAEYVVKEFDVSIINDISAGELDDKMFDVVAKLNVAYILMHMQGTPKNMQSNPQYDDLIKDIIKYFSAKIDKLNLLGVKDVIIDPGFGFGKTLDNNYELMQKLDAFKILQLPILVGISRKSMIYKYLDTKPAEALTGTIVLNTIALLNDANILRVHDVKEAVETIKIVEKIQVKV